MSDIKLLPCPFCGREPKYESFNDEFFNIHRIKCKCGIFYDAPTKESALEWWNTRKPIERIVEQLEKEIQHSESMCCGYLSERTSGECAGFHKAIEIVKAGGKDERIH